MMFRQALIACALCSFSSGAAAAGKLVFSEYMEGSYYNKAVEIANVGDAAVDFAATPYTVSIFRSGETRDRAVEIKTGTLAVGAVLIVAHPDATELLAQPKVQATRVVIYSGLDFNGDDAVALEDASNTVLDLVGSRPMGTDLLRVVTIRRLAVDTTHAVNGFTTLTATSWVTFQKDDVSGFGCVGIAPCTQSKLVFSEYMEGSYHNKAVEIANVGDAVHDFTVSPIKVTIFRSGVARDRTVEIKTGSLAVGEVLIVANTKATELLAQPKVQATRVVLYSGLDFNGDDAVAIVDVATDSVRDLVGSRPMSTDILRVVTIRRQASDKTQDADGFITLAATSWVTFPKDDVSGFGCIGVCPCAQSKLVFSEYMEGSYHNKAVEIANVGDAVHDFTVSPIKVAIFRSGVTRDREVEIKTGSLAVGEVLIVANTKATELLAQPKVQATRVVLYSGLDFNGDDAVALEDVATDSVRDLVGSLPMNNDILRVVTIRRLASDKTQDADGFTTLTTTPWATFQKDDVSGFGCIGVCPCAQSKLVFSEYLEGTYLNKAVEIANVGDAVHDFTVSPIKVTIFRSGDVADKEILVNTGSLQPLQVLVVANTEAMAVLSLLPAYAPVVTTELLDFNGNDAVGIVDVVTGTVRDLIGSRPTMNNILADVTVRKLASATAQNPAGFTSLPIAATQSWVTFAQPNLGDGFGCLGVAPCMFPRVPQIPQ